MRATILVSLLAVLLPASGPALGGPPAGVPGPVLRRPLLPDLRDLGPNPGFEEGEAGRPAGWNLFRGGTALEWGDFGIEGSKGIRFRPPEKAPTRPGFSGVNAALTSLEAGKTIEVTAWLRLTGFSGALVVWARCDGEEGPERRPGAFQNSTGAGYAFAGSTIWSPVTVRVTPGKETRRVVFGVLVRGRGTVQLDELHAAVRGTAPTLAAGPGLYRVEGRYRAVVRKATPRLRVHIPLPVLWREQVPLDFSVATDPPGRARVERILRVGEFDRVAEVVLTDLAPGRPLSFSWEAHVLVLPHAVRPISKGIPLPLAAVPKDVAAWLAPTWCCDAKDPRIEKIAREIRKAAPAADAAVPALLTRLRRIYREAKGRVRDLTAGEALTGRGSCTSCANLAAALLRALGIPARIVAGYPTWCGPLQTHYVVEYWLPRGGWRLLESTRCLDDRPGWEQIEVSVVLPENEREDRAKARPGAAGGVPRLTLTEYPDYDDPAKVPAWLAGAMPGRPGCDHRAVRIARYEAEPRAWKAAAAALSARWRKLLTRGPAALTPRPETEGARTLPALLNALHLSH